MLPAAADTAQSQTNANAAAPALSQASVAAVAPDTGSTPTPTSAINATSGDATAAAGVAQSSTDNTQLLGAVAGGGNGSLTAANQHTGSVTDTSSANAQSGLSVALAPTVAPGSQAPTGITTAESGKTSATGLVAHNSVSNTSVGVVDVVGASEAPVSAISSSTIDIKDTAASGAASGAAWAVARGAAGNPAGVAAPDVTGASAASVPASATGLTAENSVYGKLDSAVTVPGGPQTAHSISFVGNESYSVTNGGAALAMSAPATTGAADNGTDTRAASGSTSAVGLTASNAVDTHASVSVHVRGQNFSPIQVIVDSITRVFNLGVASSTSGDATAVSGGAGSGATTTAASSASAVATGAQVQSTVNMRSSADIHVEGDNYNPISIVLNLAANIMNWGVGLARSGDAQSGGSGGAATSGGASASGLQVMNLVSMWADASVDVNGNNYAPIYVRISFNTNIDNRGFAAASSGNVAAGQPAQRVQPAADEQSPAVHASTGSGSSTSSGYVGTSVRATGGNATAISNSVTANVVSTQLSSANGSKPVSASTLARAIHAVSADTLDPFFQQTAPADPPQPVQDGLTSHSGDGLASGMQSQVNQTNTQMVACKDPTVSCVGANLATLSIAIKDGERNLATQGNDSAPGPGGVHVTTGDTLANVTPTPTPTPKPDPAAAIGMKQSLYSSSAGSRSSPHGGSSSRRGSTSGRGGFTKSDLLPTGHTVLVDLWDQWPGRRLPPMPNPVGSQPRMSTVSASLGGWPGAEELPLPEPGRQAPESDTQTQPQSAPGRRSSSDVAATDGESFPVMQLADVDAWAVAISPDALPMPLQALPGAAHLPSRAPTADSALPVAPDDPGAAPVEFGLAAVVSVLAGLLAMRRGHLLFALRKVRLAISSARRKWLSVLHHPAQRMLAIVRLTLGVLRLW